MGSTTVTVSFSPKDDELFNFLLHEAGVKGASYMVGRHLKAFLYAYMRMLKEGSTFEVELAQTDDGKFTANIPTLEECVLKADSLEGLSEEVSKVVRYYLWAELDTSELPEEEI